MTIRNQVDTTPELGTENNPLIHNPVSSKCFLAGEPGRQQIALTFDTEILDQKNIHYLDQKNTKHEEAVLELLDQYGLKVTFFVTGQWADTFPLCMQRIVAQGHEVGNHTYNHPHLTQITSSEVMKEVIAAEETIQNIGKVSSRPLFRPTYLEYNDAVLVAVGQAGFSTTVSANLDPRDWELPSVEEISRRILESVKDGDIILLHSWAPNTVQAMHRVIPILKDRGLKMVTVSELLRLDTNHSAY